MFSPKMSAVKSASQKQKTNVSTNLKRGCSGDERASLIVVEISVGGPLEMIERVRRIGNGHAVTCHFCLASVSESVDQRKKEIFSLKFVWCNREKLFEDGSELSEWTLLREHLLSPTVCNSNFRLDDLAVKLRVGTLHRTLGA